MISIKEIIFLNEIGGRPQLEDSIYPAPGNASSSDKLFMVCDGVGGESMGEEASRIACEGFSSWFKANPIAEVPLPKEYFKQGQKYVLQKMQAYAAENPEAERMSTTLTLIYFDGQGATVAWCGDSGVYHLRNGQIQWRSGDHSLVANLVKHGEITAEEAKSHPKRNVITRSLSASGAPSEIETHYIADICDDDYFMLCTDGVLEQINDDRLKGILQNSNTDKKDLFLTYSHGKTKDNFSLYLLKINSDRVPVNKKTNKFLVPVILALVGLALIAVSLRKPFENWLNPPKTNKETVHQKNKTGEVGHLGQSKNSDNGTHPGGASNTPSTDTAKAELPQHQKMPKKHQGDVSNEQNHPQVSTPAPNDTTPRKLHSLKKRLGITVKIEKDTN